MHVQVLHDNFIRLEVATGVAPVVHVTVEKQHVTAMGKGVGSSWSSDSATVNLSSNPLVDVVLYSTSPHQHRVVVSSVVDTKTVQALYQVVLDGRHLCSTILCDQHFVLGAEAVAKHLIAKHIGIPSLCCSPHRMHSYTQLHECEAEFQKALVRTENARQHGSDAHCRVHTVGSQAFRLFQRFNTTSTSKITSAFPEHSLEFAQSVCLAAGFLANATNTPRSGVLIAHSLQQVAVNAETARHLQLLAAAALSDSTECPPVSKSFPATGALSAVPEHFVVPSGAPTDSADAPGAPDNPAAPDGPAAPDAPAAPAAPDAPDAPDASDSASPADFTSSLKAGLKRGRLSMLLDTGSVYTTPFVTLGEESRRLLATSNVYTRSETPMYMVFDRQCNAVLVADVAMHQCEVLGGGVQMFGLSATQQVVADMHFVNVSTAYHPELMPRRQLLLKKACKAICKPSQYTASIFKMLRYEQGPMLALLAEQDL